ncbi:hypothetical protein AB1Y20_021377 [Prymnesium parvum]|uniref:Uncharacterized protein n=1 Tax=Prymnesium parvum TaxID=97485 RepID=A0AB34JLW9_PRYPA
MSERERIAILLDLRTLKASGFKADQFLEAEKLLENAYVMFGKRALQHEQEKQALEASQRAESQATTSSKAAATKDELESGFEYDDAMFDDSDDDANNSGVADLDQTSALAVEFKTVFKTWKKLKVNWKEYFPDCSFPDDMGHLDLVSDLMRLPMGRLYKQLIKSDPLRLAYGWLPLMALCSRGQLGTLLAESFCERVLSQGNLVMTDGNTLLSHEELEMVVTLRMNREFMHYMRQHYNHLSKQDFARTVVRV